MTESTRPGEGWTASAGDDAWTPATSWTADEAAAQAGAPTPAVGGGHGQTLQGFGDVTEGHGSLSFGADDATTEIHRPSPGGAELMQPEPAPAPTAVPNAVITEDSESIACPECGTTAVVTLNRRDSVDFCRTCDYPLFWTPSKVLRDRTNTEESLRRLPGTEGRATIASLPCPHCAEPNSLSAQICVRCGQPMHPVAAPEPEPVFFAPPPVEYEEEPEEPSSKLLAWILLVVMVVTLVTLVVLAATHVID
jgi:hypothetical protein